MGATNTSVSDLAAAVGADIGALQLEADALNNHLASVNDQIAALRVSGVSGAVGYYFSAQESFDLLPITAIESQDNVRRFYKLVRDFVLKAKPWTDAIRYHSQPDERWDMTLVSRRVYGNPMEFVTVLAAANLDSVEQMLPEQLLTLPTATALHSLKKMAGFENNPDYRA